MTDTVPSSVQSVPTFWLWFLIGLTLLVFLSTAVLLYLHLIQNQKHLGYSTMMENQQRTFSDSLERQQKLIDKMIAVLATKDPMAFQAVQAMNTSALQSDPVQEDYERSYDDVTGARYGNLDDPAIAAELTGLL